MQPDTLQQPRQYGLCLVCRGLGNAAIAPLSRTLIIFHTWPHLIWLYQSRIFMKDTLLCKESREPRV